MTNLFFSGSAPWFAVPAIVGTVFFALRLILLSIGAGHDVGSGVDLDIDPSHNDPTEGFKVLSIQSIAAFMMGFGWAGLGAFRGTGLTIGVSAAIGAAGGAAMVWLMAILLKAVYDLEVSGTAQLRSAIGNEAEVYANIPENGKGSGQVKVVVGGRTRYPKAISDGENFPTGTRVRIVSIDDGRSVRVVRA